MRAKAEDVEAILNKAQSLVDGLRATWLRREIEGMLDDAQAMQTLMDHLTDEVQRA